MTGLEAFLKRIPGLDPDKCWPYPGAQIGTSGYRGARYQGRQMPAHRAVYIATGHTIPAGLQLDHVCRNRACANPAHLEPVTARENLERGVIARRALGLVSSDGPRPEYVSRIAEAAAGARPIPHGTVNGYSNYGCRCGECRTAEITYRRERRHARQAVSA